MTKLCTLILAFLFIASFAEARISTPTQGITSGNPSNTKVTPTGLYEDTTGNWLSNVRASGGSAGKLVAVGDSIISLGFSGSTTGTNGYNTNVLQRGYISWLQYLTGNAFNFIPEYNGTLTPMLGNNAAIAGEYSYATLARFSRDVLSQKPDVVLINIGENDVKNDVTADTTFSNIKTMVELSLGGGAKHVIVMAIWPRNNSGGTALSAPQEATRILLNTKLKTYAGTMKEKVSFMDTDSFLLDPATGLLNAAYTYDGVHPSPIGAYGIAVNYLIPWFKKFSGSSTIPKTVTADYNVSTNPYGNLLTNSAFSGTSGTKGGMITGTVPTSWSASRDIGTTVTGVASIVSRTNWNGDAANFMQLVYTADGGGAANQLMSFRPAAAITTGVVAGTWYMAEVEAIAEAPTGTDPLESMYALLTDTTTDSSYVSAFSAKVQAGELFPTNDVRVLLRTPPVRADSTNGLTLSLFTRIDGTKTGTKTISWGQPKIIPVSTPNFGETKNVSVYGVGTAYALTATPAAVTLGTTSPSMTLPEPGRYLINVNATINYNGATFAANRDVTLKVTRTNFTATDLTGSTNVTKTGIVTTTTSTLASPSWSFYYDCTGINEILSLYGSVSVVPSAGQIEIAGASMTAARISDVP